MPISTELTPVVHTLTGAVVPPNGVLFVDCITNNSTSLVQIDYPG